MQIVCSPVSLLQDCGIRPFSEQSRGLESAYTYPSSNYDIAPARGQVDARSASHVQYEARRQEELTHMPSSFMTMSTVPICSYARPVQVQSAAMVSFMTLGTNAIAIRERYHAQRRTLCADLEAIARISEAFSSRVPAFSSQLASINGL